MSQQRLQRQLLLVIATTCVGFLLCKLCCNVYLPIQSRPTSRWKLFGEAFISEGVLSRPGALQRRSAGQEGLFAVSSQDERNELFQRLEALQVSCHSHPESGRVLERKYAKFLNVLSIYTAFHRQERNGESTKRLIWFCDLYGACGGLADRIKGLTYALILAILSQRVLILDWGDSQFGEQSFLLPNAIDWRFSEEDQRAAYSYYDADNRSYNNSDYWSENGPVSLHLFSILDGLGVDVSVHDLEMSFDIIEGQQQWVQLASNMEPSSLLNSTKTAFAEWIEQGMASLGLAALSPDDVDGLVGLVFRYLFTFSDDLISEVVAARRVLGLDNQEYVGVHVRTGFAGSEQQEDMKHPKLIYRALEWEQILSCAHRIATEKLGSRSLLFLATDSHLVKNRTLDVHRYRGRFRTLDNSVVHLDRLEKYPHNAEDSEVEGVFSAWIDLILLAESHSLVHGESGFSFLAQSICFMPETNVINRLKCSPSYIHDIGF